MAALNYNHLRLFWVVAHEGNLTRAARRLNLSQSALSAQIATLEHRIGHQLFERRNRGLHLTEAGRIALAHADSIFATGEELLAALSAAGPARATVRVGALATLSRNFQLRFLKPLIGRADVAITLRSGSPPELLAGLEGLSLDLLLLNQPPPLESDTRFLVRQLAEEPVSLVGTAARIAGREDLAALLASEPVVLPPPGTSIRLGFDALVDRLGVEPRVAAEVDDMAMLRLLVREDEGLAPLPPIVVADELAAGLVAEAAALPGLAETFFAVTLARRFPNPLVTELLAGW
ncbi:MAG: LysR family transcriptional regulator [Sphingomonadaceae bacterium]